MRIALIGASGQLGTDLQKIIPAKNLINFNYPAFDLTKPAVIQRQLFKAKPDIIINTAAYNLVDRAEEFQSEALTVNYIAVKNLVAVVQKLKSILIHFSTDYVFGADKNRRRPYNENDMPSPLNNYGRSKLLGEQFVRKNLKKYFLIRTSGLFGTAGSAGKGGNFIESIIKKAAIPGRVPRPRAGNNEQSTKNAKATIKVVDDQILTPTYTLDLAKQVWHLITSSAVSGLEKPVEFFNYGLYHITSQGECSWYEFASEVFKILKRPVKIVPIKSSALNLKATRPAYSVLENKRLRDLGLNIMRFWPVTVADYLKEKGHL